MTRETMLALAEEYVAKWKPRRRLADWDIGVRMADADNAMVRETNCYLYIDFDFTGQTAVIFLSPRLFHKLGECPEDNPLGVSDEEFLEECVVHELGHLREAPHYGALKAEIREAFGDESLIGKRARLALEHYREHMIEMGAREVIAADRGAWEAA